MPDLKETDIEVRAWRMHDYGGQQVGVESSVIVLHKPTGIAVVRGDERSQMKNKAEALTKLRALLLSEGWT